MRTLCLLARSPVPADDERGLRLMHLLEALRSLGSIDLAFEQPITATDLDAVREACPGSRVFAPAKIPRYRIGRLRWLTSRRLPFRVALVDREPLWRDIGRFVDGSPEPYELTWSFGATPAWTFAAINREVPLVIDFPTLQRNVLDRSLPEVGRQRRRWTFAPVQNRVSVHMDRERWMRFERAQGERANLVTVGNVDDREALGVPGAIVVSNGSLDHGVECAPMEASFADRVHAVVADATRFESGASGLAVR